MRALIYLLAALPAAALAQKPAEPPRPTDWWVSSQQSLIDLQACTTRTLAKFGTASVIPMQNGVALDFQLKSGLFASPGQPIMTFEIHEAGEQRRITAAYRHPWSKKNSWGLFKDLAKRCFPQEWETAGLVKPE